jgi:hypothetical protein
LKSTKICPMYRAIYQKQPKAQVKFTEDRLSEMSQPKLDGSFFVTIFFLRLNYYKGMFVPFFML